MAYAATGNLAYQCSIGVRGPCRFRRHGFRYSQKRKPKIRLIDPLLPVRHLPRGGLEVAVNAVHPVFRPHGFLITNQAGQAACLSINSGFLC